MHGCKNINMKDHPIRTKMRNEMTNHACIELSFLLFSVNFNKQDELVNNN